MLQQTYDLTEDREKEVLHRMRHCTKPLLMKAIPPDQGIIKYK